MLRSRRAARVSFGVVVAIILAGALTTVGAQVSPTTISACVHRVSGIVRIPPAGAACQPAESVVQWNIVGPLGPKGDPGDPGPTGDASATKGLTMAVYGSVDKDGGWVDPSQQADWWSDYQYMYSNAWLYVVELLTFKDSTKCPMCAVSARPNYNGAYYEWTHQQVAIVSIAWSNYFKAWRFYVYSSQFDASGNPVPLKQGFDFICVQK